MIAFCGLQCDTCPIFLATIEEDKSKQREMRKSIADDCREHYNMQLQPDEITDCDGCKSNTGRLFSGCVNCEIRKCAGEKMLESCEFCPDFACTKLEDMFLLDPGAKARLLEIRNTN